MHKALTIAGSDSGGGAGIQADLKTFHQHGVFGTSAITLVTAQNTVGVFAVELMRPELLQKQLDAVLTDIGADAVKTGALGSSEIIEVVAATLEKYSLRKVVVDPVMISKHGGSLLEKSAEMTLKTTLLPKALLLTPNLLEAEALVPFAVRTLADMERAARHLFDTYGCATLIKGGHLEGEAAIDVLFDGRELASVRAPRIVTKHSHGTGCTFSAAITAHLARGKGLSDAVSLAKIFVTNAIKTAPEIGHGYGPLNHFAEIN